MRIKRTGQALAWLAGMVSVGACDRSNTTEPVSLHTQQIAAARSPTATEHAGLVNSLRAATARYHSTAVAKKDGYLDDPHCVEVPVLGAMGHHWANPSLVDPVFEATKPEVLLYAPDEHGRLRLLGVEYIVVNTGQTRPSFDGQLFDVGGAPLPVPHWTLHVWLYESNPSGLFAPFNPNVDCP